MEQQFLQYCAPTLAGIKPASLFRTRTPVSLPAMPDVSVQFLTPDQTLLLVYRPALLTDILAGDAGDYLAGLGYPHDVSGCIETLRTRLQKKAFPHEVGLLLGYPIWDVEGFVQHQGKDYLFLGYWKVYADAKGARTTFDAYAQCEADLRQKYHANQFVFS